MNKEIIKKYDNGEITVVWQPQKCIHSAICFRGLPSVFDPTRRPWVTVDGASSEEIMRQVSQCPSGGLTYTVNEDKAEGEVEQVVAETVVEVLPNGPLLVYGNLAVKDYAGNEQKKSKVTAFCRCGGSKNKPYCDGTHAKVGFGG